MRTKTILLLCASLLGACAANVQAEEPAWAALREARSHVVVRHAEAPGVGDPAGFRLGDCATQRNLSNDGRAQARRISEQFKAEGIEIDHVLTSRWCRASETARLLDLGPVREDPALDSFFEDRSTAERQTQAVAERLKALDEDGDRAVLVTHQVNISALTGVGAASGEMVVIRLNGDDVETLGRIRTPTK